MGNRKNQSKPTTILNRRAKFDYNLKEDLSVGIVLTGREVRSARDGHVQLKGSFVSVRNNELWLNNASFSIKNTEKNSSQSRSIDTSPRKLLAKKQEIDKLLAKKTQGISIVPVKMITSGKYIKLIIALGEGKKTYDKRETIKRRQQDREIKRNLKHY